MALVEITSGSLHAGANLRKLEVGEIVEVDDSTAKRWIETGKAKETDKKKGTKLTSFEVATPSAPVSTDTSVIQLKLDEALAQVQTLTEAAATKETDHAESLAKETKRAEDAEAALAEALKKAK